MGWTFSTWTREGMIRELVASQESESYRREVVEYTLVDDVLWSVIRITAKQHGFLGLDAGEAACFIGCDPLRSEDGEWGYTPLAEVDHPYYYSCPLHYLDMAPVQCAEWRKRVRAHHADAEARRNRFSPAPL